MENKLKPSPFYDWMPRPLGITVYLLMFIPILFNNGVYVNTMTEMYSALGLHSEDVQFANFVTSIGNAAFAPFMIYFLKRRRTKVVYVFGFLAMMLFCEIAARTQSVPVLVGSCFMIGFIRVMLVLNTTFGLFPYITGKDMTQAFFGDVVSEAEQNQMDRFRMVALPVYYFFLIVISQLGNALASIWAFHSDWQSVHIYMMLFTLIALLLVLLTIKPEMKKSDGKDSERLQIPEMLLFITASVALCFFLLYGKMLDWFNSRSIRIASALVLGCGGLLLIFITRKKNPYIHLEILRKPNVCFALILLCLAMIFNSTSVFITLYSSISMTLDSLQTANLYNFTIWGFLLGTVIAFVMIRKKMKNKFVFAVGFLLLTASVVVLYLHYQSEELYNHLRLPVLLRSTGMIIVYSVGSVYGMMKLPGKLRPSWICLMLIARSVLGPVAGISLYSNVLYEKQNEYTVRFAQEADGTNYDVAAAFQRTQTAAMMQGASYENAQSLATLSLNGRIQKQAALAALKEVTGYVIWGGTGCLAFIFLFPFPVLFRRIPRVLFKVFAKKRSIGKVQ
ncbi:MAG: hypothetical protein LBT04_00210 [Prevotellaceae bacterium]|jgi:hypothetical protein|nr:hypothetical protein [Prevotellaceae bacterium]